MEKREASCLNFNHEPTCNLYCRKYELEDDTIDFIGHALALHFTDSYLDEPALDFVKRMKVETFNTNCSLSCFVISQLSCLLSCNISYHILLLKLNKMGFMLPET